MDPEFEELIDSRTGASSRPVTPSNAYRMLQSVLVRARRQMQVVGEIAQAKEILSGDVESLARIITERAAAMMACERVNVWLFDETETTLECIDAYSATTQSHASGTTLSEAQYRNEFQALKHSRYVAADDALTDPRTIGYADSYLKPLGITSMLDTVIHISGKHLGLLCFEHVGRAHHWDREEISFAEQLADKLGLALVSRARRKLEDDLKASAARFRMLLDQAPDAIFVYDYDQRCVVDANESAERLFGCSRQELIANGPAHYYADAEGDPKAVAASVEDHNLRVLAGEKLGFDRRIRNALGRDLVCEVRQALLPSAEGKRLIRSSFTDVTERRQSEERLQFANVLLASEIESAPDGVLVVDTESGLASWNTRFQGVWKLAATTVASRDPDAVLADILPQLAWPEVFAADVAAFRADPSVPLHRELNLIDGRVIECHTGPLRGPGGRMLGRINFFRDVTAHKRAEEESRQARRLLESILNAIPVRVFWKDRDLRFLGCNKPFAQDAGFSDPAQLVGKSDFDMAWHDEAELYCADDRLVIESGKPTLLIEEPQTMPDGSTRTLLTSKLPLRDAAGNIDGVLGIYMDISERKRAEEAVKHSAAELREAQRLAHMGSWTWDPDSDRLVMSAELLRIFGLDPSKPSPPLKAFARILAPESFEAMMAAATRAQTDGTPYLLDIRFMRPEGVPGWLLLRGEAVQDREGTVTGIRGTCVDITERKLAEDRLRAARSDLAEAQEIAHVGSWQFDVQDGVLTWSDESYRILGVEPRAFIPLFETLLARVHPDDRANVEAVYARAARDCSAFGIDHRVVLDDGTIRTLHHRGRAIRGQGVTTARLIGTIQDVTDRKEAEDALAYRDRVLHAVTDSSVDFVAARSMSEPRAAALCGIAEALRLDRLLLVREPAAANGYQLSLLQAWQAPSVPAVTEDMIRTTFGNPANRWLPPSSERQPLINTAQTAPGAVGELLRHLQVLSNLVVPIVVDGDIWGHVIADDCHSEREWSSVEIDALKTLAEVVGALMYREQVRTSLQQSEERFRAVSETAQDAIITIDSKGKIVYWNGAAERNLGYTAQEALGQDVHELLAPVAEREKAALGLQAFARTGKGLMVTGVRELAARRKDGSEIPVEASVSAMQLDASWHAVAFLRDITERKQSEAFVETLARHDALTGLPNRRVFVDTLEAAIAQAQRERRSFAVLYLDLDHFKDVNDTLGHPVGDLLLKEVAARLQAAARAGDTVARFGGDEFAVLQVGLAHPGDAAVFAERLLASIATPFLLAGNEIRTGTSVGISVFDPACDAEKLLSQADVALYRAKAEGRGTFRFFTESMDTEVHTRVRLAAELRQALALQQLFLVYQPQVDVDTGRIIGLEALVRWQHPERGLVGPAEFVPVAETSGLIVAIGQWALLEACRQARRWLDAGIDLPLVAVNLSGLQFKSPHELESQIEAILAETRIPPQSLELELTESILMDASQEHNDVLLRLRARGLRLAIDDFGTGYSSLDYLRRFPVDRIKIAQNFIAELTSNNGDAVIVKAALSLTRALQLPTIVEGVETAEQLALLQTWGCREVQGYYYSRPLPPSEITPLLRAGVIVRPPVKSARKFKAPRPARRRHGRVYPG